MTKRCRAAPASKVASRPAASSIAAPKGAPSSHGLEKDVLAAAQDMESELHPDACKREPLAADREVDDRRLALSCAVRFPDAPHREGRFEQAQAGMRLGAQTLVRIGRHGAQRLELKGRVLGRQQRLLAQPLEARHVRKISIVVRGMQPREKAGNCPPKCKRSPDLEG